MTDALAPCPFCGGRAKLHPSCFGMKDERYEIECTGCGMATGLHDLPELVTAWNRRADLSPALGAAATRPHPLNGLHRYVITPKGEKRYDQGDWVYWGDLVQRLGLPDSVPLPSDADLIATAIRLILQADEDQKISLKVVAHVALSITLAALEASHE